MRKSDLGERPILMSEGNILGLLTQMSPALLHLDSALVVFGGCQGHVWVQIRTSLESPWTLKTCCHQFCLMAKSVDPAVLEGLYMADVSVITMGLSCVLSLQKRP